MSPPTHSTAVYCCSPRLYVNSPGHQIFCILNYHHRKSVKARCSSMVLNPRFSWISVGLQFLNSCQWVVILGQGLLTRAKQSDWKVFIRQGWWIPQSSSRTLSLSWKTLLSVLAPPQSLMAGKNGRCSSDSSMTLPTTTTHFKEVVSTIYRPCPDGLL